MRKAALLLASVLFLPPALTLSAEHPTTGVASAEASVSVLLSLDELLTPSSYVIVGTAGEKKSRWEEIGGGRRIVTYTKIQVDTAIVGSPGSALWVRTLGGSVGDIGQTVSGEAQIATGSKSVLFLQKRGSAIVVTGMAQGHFPVVADSKGVVRLRPSPDAGVLLPSAGPSISARSRLVGKGLLAAVSVIRDAGRDKP
ncbi:MAG: hypothetical protein U0441_35825 [Polyangiaceae bacterium]